MSDMQRSTLVVANDLRKAESSINAALRDTAQFLMSTLDFTETHKVPAAVAQRTVKATVASLNALAEGQDRLALRAHAYAERAARMLGLEETAWGGSAPKPGIDVDDLPEIIDA